MENIFAHYDLFDSNKIKVIEAKLMGMLNYLVKYTHEYQDELHN